MHFQNLSENSTFLPLPSSLSDAVLASGCCLAGRNAFIYALCEKRIGALYIGQTCNPYGALGRFAQHLSWDTDSNTFRRRVLKVLNIDEIEFKNIELLGVPLPDETKYQSSARDYREAVESLVYDYVLEYLTNYKNRLNLCLVSRAYRHPYRKNEDVIKLAKRIGEEICSWISAIKTR